MPTTHCIPVYNWHPIFILQPPLRTVDVANFKHFWCVFGHWKNEIQNTRFPCVTVMRERLTWNSRGTLVGVWRSCLHNYMRHSCQLSEIKDGESTIQLPTQTGLPSLKTLYYSQSNWNAIPNPPPQKKKVAVWSSGNRQYNKYDRLRS
jgi:hypothetical protein